MKEYFLIRNGQIVNCVTTLKTLSEVQQIYELLGYEVTESPSQAQLEQYEYYWKRPP